MKKNHIGTIKETKEINHDVFSLKIYSPTLKNIVPGEYISILCENLTFRRPFSVADFEENTVQVLIKRRGKGTKFLSELKVGDNFEFSAPLGNTFKIENKKTLLIGAGIGIAPLLYLNKELKKIGAETFLAAGFLKVDDIVDISPRPHGERVRVRGSFDFISTDDGSNGNKGSICDYLEKLASEFKPEKIVTCAPHPVLEFIAKFAEQKNIECEVCMEKIMACGIGVCRGCAIKIKKDGEIINKTVCKDGPVFNGLEVVW